MLLLLLLGCSAAGCLSYLGGRTQLLHTTAACCVRAAGDALVLLLDLFMQLLLLLLLLPHALGFGGPGVPAWLRTGSTLTSCRRGSGVVWTGNPQAAR